MLFRKDRVVKAIDEDLIFVKEGHTGARIYEGLIASTSCGWYQGALIMSAPTSTLHAELLTAGEALAGIVFLADAEMAVSESLLRSICKHMIKELV